MAIPSGLERETTPFTHIWELSFSIIFIFNLFRGRTKSSLTSVPCGRGWEVSKNAPPSQIFFVRSLIASSSLLLSGATTRIVAGRERSNLSSFRRSSTAKILSGVLTLSYWDIPRVKHQTDKIASSFHVTPACRRKQSTATPKSVLWISHRVHRATEYIDWNPFPRSPAAAGQAGERQNHTPWLSANAGDSESNLRDITRERQLDPIHIRCSSRLQ